MSSTRQAHFANYGPAIACPLPTSGSSKHASVDGILLPLPVEKTPSPPNELPSNLDVLVNDCFQSKMDPSALSPERLEYARSFEKYLLECHSQENLAFLVEIFRYEYFFARLVPESDKGRVDGPSSKLISLSLVDSSLEQFMQTLPFPTYSASKHLRKVSLKSPSSASISSSIAAPFDLEIEEPVPDAQDIWNKLSLTHIAEDLDSDAGSITNFDSDDHAGLVSPTYDDAEALLADQWTFIMRMYIEDESECQINLSNKTYREIIAVDTLKNEHHSPMVLLAAKAEVMRLLYENAYHSFVRKMRTCCTTTDNDCTHSGRSTPGTGSSLSLPQVSAKKVDFSAGLVKFNTIPSTPSSASSHTGQTPSSVPKNNGPAAPIPKKRSKFLQTLSGSSSASNTECSTSPVNQHGNIILHFKSSSVHNTSSRSYSSAPQTPVPSSRGISRGPSPLFSQGGEDIIPRPRSSAVPEGSHSTSIFGKLWKKRR